MEDLKIILRNEVEEFRSLGHKFSSGELTVPQFKHASGGMGVYAQRGGKEFMVRLRIPSGVTNVEELKYVYKFMKDNNLGGIHFTTRQAIQLHGMDIDSVCDLIKEALDVNIYTRGAGGNFPRNVALSPLSGVDKEEIFDPTAYALAAGNHFLQKIHTYKLPRKLKVSFSNSDKDTAHCTVQDLGFIATNKDGKEYFKVFVGGGLGNNPKKAIELDELIEPRNILYYIEGITRLFVNEGDYQNKNKARLRYVVDKLGEEEFVRKFKAYSKEAKEKGGLDLSIKENKINKEGKKIDIKSKRLFEQKQEGLYSIYLHPIGGQLKSEDFKDILDTVDKFEDIDIRLAMSEGIYFRNLNGDEAKLLLELTEKMGGNTKISHSVSCIGVPTCQIGIANSQGLLKNIIEYFDRNEYISDVLPKVNISGCSNSCGVHQIGLIGFTGKKKKVGDGIKEVFSLFINGSNLVGETRIGLSKGEILPERIPEFLYKLSKKIEDKNVGFEEYIKKNTSELDELISEYAV